MKILKEIQCDLNIQKHEINSIQENITKAVNDNISEKFAIMEHRTSNIEMKTNQQQKAINYLAKQASKKNLRFYEVEETEHGYEELQSILLHSIKDNMEIFIERSKIDYLKRLGNAVIKTLVTFTTLGPKIEILKKKGSL